MGRRSYVQSGLCKEKGKEMGEGLQGKERTGESIRGHYTKLTSLVIWSVIPAPTLPHPPPQDCYPPLHSLVAQITPTPPPSYHTLLLHSSSLTHLQFTCSSFTILLCWVLLDNRVTLRMLGDDCSCNTPSLLRVCLL